MKKIIHNNYFLAFISGVLGVFSLAPFDIFIFLMISFSCFYFLLERVKDSLKSTFWLGFFYGFGFFIAGLYWISISLLVDFNKFFWLIPFAVTLIPAALSVYIGLTALIYRKICDKYKIEFDYHKIIILAVIFVVFEVLRSHILTGFSWNLVGYSMMFSKYSSQSGSLFGVYGLSFIAILFALMPVLYVRKSNLNIKFLMFLAMIFMINFSYGYIRVNSNKLIKTSDKARIVQGNIKQTLKWDPYLKYRNFRKHINLSLMEDISDIKLVVWPETAVPYAIGVSDDLDNELRNLVSEDSFLVTGALRLEFRDSIKNIKSAYNSVFLVENKKEMKFYDKHHLVPFGEYVPLQKYLPFIDKITGGGSGFSEGDGPKTIESKGIKVSPLICYEVIFSDKIIDRENRPDLLVNVTNDAWFGNSSGPYQHFNMARMRAIEYGISLIRAANTGISAYIDPFGREVQKISLNDSGFIDVSLIKPLDETIYSQFKYFVVLLLLSIFSIFVIIDLRIKRR